MISPDSGLTAPAPDPSVKISKENVLIGQEMNLHPDYKRKNCDKCHTVEHSYRLKQRQPDLCYQCHPNFTSKFSKLHGPVAAGFCTTCHEPHKSTYKALLKMPVRDVCQHCHEAGDVVKNVAHQKINKTECLQCHDPHGGKSADLIRMK